MMQSLVYLLAVATAASASALLPRVAPSAPNLPASAFPKFPHLSQADFAAGKDNVTASPSSTTFTPFSLAASPASAACSANPNVRIEWRSYPASSKQGFINAIKCMMSTPPSGNYPPSTSRYEDFARLHQMYMPNIHGNPKFLIWHRYFLWTFQMALRDQCGFWDPLPWWDETLDAGNFHSSDMFTNPNYFGPLPGPDGNVCLVLFCPDSFIPSPIFEFLSQGWEVLVEIYEMK
jgi:tyrosinase